METSEGRAGTTNSCTRSRQHLGLSFTIDNLLFNKGVGSTEGEARAEGKLGPQLSERHQSRADPCERDTPKAESHGREKEGSEGESKRDGGKEDREHGTSTSANPEDKPTQSYIALISMAILASEEKKLLLCDIYQWIMDHYPYFKNKDKNWKNSVRHNLSLNECFMKAGRSDNGKGHFWAIHPANIQDFSNGDYQRRRARRRIHSINRLLPLSLLPPHHPGRRIQAVSCWCCPPAPMVPCYSPRVYWRWASLPGCRLHTLL